MISRGARVLDLAPGNGRHSIAGLGFAPSIVTSRRFGLLPNAAARCGSSIEGAAILKLPSIGVEISLDAIYEDTELDVTRPREGERRVPAS